MSNLPNPKVSNAMGEALHRSDAFRSLPPEKQHKMHQDLDNVMGYLTDPAAGDPSLAPVARTMADGVDQAVDPNKTNTVDRAAGTFGALKNQVNFGGFVSELIQNVYQAIVNASIQQMEAYTKMLEQVVGSVQQFANTHITEVEASDYMVSMFPSALQYMNGQVSLKDDVEDEDKVADEVKKKLPGFKGDVDFSDPGALKAMVNQAKLKLARQKQQLLATMVLMGINRIVVTDGQINAKVKFKVNAREAYKKNYKSESQKVTGDAGEGQGSWDQAGQGWSGGFGNSTGMVGIGTTKEELEGQSDNYLQAQAELTGGVRINFKSDALPLDQMADAATQAMVGATAKPKGGDQNLGGRGGQPWMRGPMRGPRGTFAVAARRGNGHYHPDAY